MGQGPSEPTPPTILWLASASVIWATDAQNYSQSTASLTSKSPLATQMLAFNSGGSGSGSLAGARPKSEPGLHSMGLNATVPAEPFWANLETG